MSVSRFNPHTPALGGSEGAASVKCWNCGQDNFCKTCHGYVSGEAEEEFSFTKYLGNNDLSDVEIVVDCHKFSGQRATFRAHRLILALQNRVFKGLFCGNHNDKDLVRVIFNDMLPGGFLGLLRYFYSGKLQVESVLQAASTRTAAEKFMVPELANKCLEYVMRRMGPADVCQYLDYLLTMGEQGFVLPASKVISANSLAVLQSKAFESSLEGTVNYILDHLTNVHEVSVLKAVHAWGSKQCIERYVARGRPYNIREVLLPLFPKLRFLALTVREFVAGQNAWGIFSAEEAQAIMSNIVSPGSQPMPAGFCTIRTPRGSGQHSAPAIAGSSGYL
ncbi:BTB/POZ domain-containing protein 6-like [Amblyomma americanum]